MGLLQRIVGISQSHLLISGLLKWWEGNTGSRNRVLWSQVELLVRGESRLVALVSLSLYTWEVCGSVSNFFIPHLRLCTFQMMLEVLGFSEGSPVFSSFEKVSCVCVFRISLWMLGRVGCYLLYFFSCCRIMNGYVGGPCSFFFFSLLLDAHSKFWPVHSWEGLQRLLFPQRHIISSVT